MLCGFMIAVIVAVLVGVKMAGEAPRLEQAQITDVCLGMFGATGSRVTSCCSWACCSSRPSSL